MAGSFIFVLVGPSGAGKTTLMKRALEDLPNLRKHVTYTTRPPRPGEIEGQDYHFVDRATLERLRDEGKLVESQEFYNNLYGSTCDSIAQAINGNTDGITSLEVLGAENLQALYPENVVTIFIFPPSLDMVRERREQRAGETTEQELVRSERTKMELSHAGQFKYALVNDDLEEAVRNVEGIIRAERCARYEQQIRQQHRVSGL